MKLPNVRKLLELRRLSAFLAGPLLIVSLAFPVWKVVLRAAQMPGQEMVIRLYMYPRISGDYELAASLNKYVGFHYPDPVFVEPNYEVHVAAINAPEWTLAPLLFVVLGLGSIVVALSSDAAFPRRARRFLATAVGASFLAVGWFQFRIYQAGHNLDPNAAMTGVDGFTIPMLGPYSVANISGFAWFDVGGYMAIAGIGLLFVAYLSRGTDATVGETPTLVGSGIERVRTTVSSYGSR